MTAVHHVAIGSADVDRLARFYQRWFELPELERHWLRSGELRSVWLAMGQGILMIESLERTSARKIGGSARLETGSVRAGVAPGFFLLAFSVTPERRLRLERQLALVDIGVEERTEYTSYIRDPDGNRVAFSHYPAESPATTDA